MFLADKEAARAKRFAIFITMVKVEKEFCFSFVYTPKKPSCLRADGTCDYDKLNVLIEQAKAGDEKATMLVFEQYQGLWKKIITEFQSKFEEYFYDYDDLQQEAFCSFLEALQQFGDSEPKNFKEFYAGLLRHDLLDCIKQQNKLVNAQCFTCSLDVRDEDGNLLYDMPDDTENDYFFDYYPQVKALLTEREFKIAILHYVDGITIKTISKELGVTSRTIDNIIKSIKSKLKVLDN